MTLCKKEDLCNKRDRSSARGVEIVNLYYLEKVSPSKFTVRKERCTTHSKMINISAEKLSDSCDLLQL